MCIEREKVDFKSCEVNCLKECTLALSSSHSYLATVIFFDVGPIAFEQTLAYRRGFNTVLKQRWS